jgi:hypothetical protein
MASKAVSRTGAAIGWLFLLHALTDLLIGVLRTLNLGHPATDLLGAAVPRAQFCLLVIWFLVGRQRWSWRLSGLVAGSSFLFIVFSRLLFPRSEGVGDGAFWFENEWERYFLASGPGDLLVKSPVLLVGITLPLLVWRWVRARRGPSAATPPARARLRLQFRVQDVAVWTVAICCSLVAIFRVPPYPGWWNELFSHWQRSWRSAMGLDPYGIYSAGLYVVAALTLVWAVHSTKSLMLRVATAVLPACLAAVCWDAWLRGLPRLDGVFPLAPETATTLTAMVLMLGSLVLDKYYPPRALT